jgi:hypothetical protein
LFERRVFDLIGSHKRWHHQELAQGRADRSKTAKVIFRQINMFEPPIPMLALGRADADRVPRQKLRPRN